MRRLLLSASLLAAFAVAAPPALAQSKDDKAAATADARKDLEKKHKDAVVEEAEAGWARAPVAEQESVTHHQVAVNGRALKYTANAGTLTIRDVDGKPTASVFYVAYTLDGANPTRRPITYFYNGGPGSASLWLHMGSFGPMRLQTGNPETIRPAPFGFGPNPDTLLDKTDLVFIDAVGAGYSRPLGDTPNKAFWGVDQDVDAFARAIMRYATKYSRWNSPKFIFGESYGTTRSGALAYELQDRGMALNGVVLLSSIMNYGSRQPGLDQVYINYLPSYAATAWYHNRIQNRPADVAEIVQQARAFAVGPYASALAKGQMISDAERDQIAQQMSALTGLSPDFIKRANLRVDLARFQKELLRDRRLTIGRFDSRYTGVDIDAAGERPGFDASDTAISGAFISTLHDYLTNELKFRTDMPYRTSAREVNDFEWDWKHRAPGANQPQNNPNTAVDLSAAMRTNPYLKVLSLNGYYDMATPFFGTEYDLNHMMLEPAQARNVQFRYYPAGHMTYLNPDALRALHADLSGFYDQTVYEAASGQPGGQAAISTADERSPRSPN